MRYLADMPDKVDINCKMCTVESSYWWVHSTVGYHAVHCRIYYKLVNIVRYKMDTVKSNKRVQ